MGLPNKRSNFVVCCQYHRARLNQFSTIAHPSNIDNVTMSENAEQISLALESLVQEEIPYICGTFSLSNIETKLFYRSPNGTNGLLDFTTTTDGSVKALANACEPASFGIGGQDVLDESYRKAGKMDAEDFSSQFTPLNHDVVRLIHKNLFKGISKRDVRVELYKLNVYGPGSFFKPHVDTPRGDDMFGSLVVVLPTKHEGGTLIFRHGEKEWTFDSAKAVEPSDSTSLKAGFAIFYSDVEHEVTPVVSGYRVTLTYNLYFGNSAAADKPHIVENSTAIEIQRCVKMMLDDPSFLPEGGLLGFKLAHKYPVSNDTAFTDTDLKSSLKGPDGCILLALEALGISTSLQIFYHIGYDGYNGEETDYMFDKPLDDGFDESYDGYSTTEFARDSKGTLVKHLELKDFYNPPSLDEDAEEEEGRELPLPTPIYWVNGKSKSATHVSTAFIAYGNQSEIAHFYGEISLVARVGPKGSRQVSDE
ncbi:hypothetical protein BJ165DRAFT_1446302 [Panaeolus papilionaceus]|nr:hypothetical protein BJ165DRAFT_1446302 [Panaeolus papilionaceus]